ncbi:MAG: hypothetical protein HUJ54_13725 [Erysipelotrichaceae bacterium]|nr:hypothetical protein [Erysipelotrichaceae bacterium]
MFSQRKMDYGTSGNGFIVQKKNGYNWDTAVLGTDYRVNADGSITFLPLEGGTNNNIYRVY